MKLSRLVSYLNHLDEFQPARSASEYNSLSRYLDNIVHLVQDRDIQFPGANQRMDAAKQEVDTAIENFDATIAQLRKIICANIELWEPNYFQASHKLYQRQKNLTNEQILSRHIELDTAMVDYVKSRVAMHSNWQHAGVIVHPANEPYIQNMVALDPLYICDTNYDIMEHSLHLFPAEYQGRVRRYLMPDRVFESSGATGAVLGDKIPHQQIGTILLYNYLNYRPLDFVLSCMRTLSMWLKPGGSVLFTFNNCDFAAAVELVEKESACYTPGRLLISGIQNANFEITHTYNLNASTTWVEARKPGILTSQRGGQALARTVAKATRNQ